MKWDYALYLVTDRNYIGKRYLPDCVAEAIEGGVTLVQLREKTASSREFYALALAVKEVTSRYKVPLIINDRLDIALAVDADGLHLGQDDLPIEIARRYFGEDKVIGISVSNVREALQAEKEGADYLGAGAVFATGTKTDAELVTLGELQRIKEAVSIPVVAIGGIKKHNAPEVLSTGIDGISVVSAILAEEDIAGAARTLRDIVDKVKAGRGK
ncbi:MAG TPA: thiamine phosphate synthase [Peptococcaceae bacterium]|nr:thiamine phosphate synthase [Peptococcaceae bacterium]